MALGSLRLAECAFLKLNVNGMEDSAHLGADTLLNTSRPIIFFERHKADDGKVISMPRKHSSSIWELPEPNVLAVRKE